MAKELDEATQAANKAADDWYRKYPNDWRGADRAADRAYARVKEKQGKVDE